MFNIIIIKTIIYYILVVYLGYIYYNINDLKVDIYIY